jgi:predicted TIM-barrel fold metal-dependent hydrolase
MSQVSPPRIDSHHHLWKYNALEYSWIDESMKILRTNFLPDDIEREIHAAGIEGVVTVQARQSMEETEWLLGLAAKHECMRGVVGWAPLRDPQVEDVLGKLAANPKLKGIRHIVQGELKWTPLSRPFSVRNKLMFDGSEFEFRAASAWKPPVAIPALEAALRSHPCGALSSVRVPPV